MSAKAAFPCALVLTVIGLGLVQGQVPPSPADDAPPAAAANDQFLSQPTLTAQGGGNGNSGPIPEGPPPAGDHALAPNGNGGGLSSWITYTRPDCCGPVGGNGPISSELYARTGPSIPIGGHFFGQVLDDGWMFQAGGRSLFFNPSLDAAWTADLSLSHYYYHDNTPDVKVVLNLPLSDQSALVPTSVTLRTVQRTFANLALGREWYLSGPCNCGDWRWRAGFDAGGRIGAAKAEFAEIRHNNDVVYGTFVALHTDLEKPCGCCTFLAGLRAEWDYTWFNRILQEQNHPDLETINLMLTLGVRF